MDQNTTTEPRIWGRGELPVQLLRDGWSRKRIAGVPGLQLAVCYVDAGYTTKAGVHTHKDTQATYVLSGRFDVEVAGERHALGIGEGIVVPAGTEHDIVCRESGSYLIVKTKPEL